MPTVRRSKELRSYDEYSDEVPRGPVRKQPLQLRPDVARRARGAMIEHGEYDGTHPDRYDPLKR